MTTHAPMYSERERPSISEQPYRVLWIYHTPAAGMYGWGSRRKMFATLDEAIAAMNEPFTGQTYRAEVDVAVNAETWLDNGRWHRLWSRRRGQKARKARKPRGSDK